MKKPVPVNSFSDIACKRCIFYRNDFDIDRCTCHLSNVAFETFPESLCSDGLFLFLNPEDNRAWVLTLQDAVLTLFYDAIKEEADGSEDAS